MTMDIYQRTMPADPSSPPAITLDVVNYRENSISTMHSPVPKKSSPPSPLIPTPCALSFPSPTSTSQKPVKRSFDVAFLMAPDDLTKKREYKIDAKRIYKCLSTTPPPPPRPLLHTSSDCETTLASNQFDSHRYQLNALSLTIKREANRSPEVEAMESLVSPFFARSAFTKVNSSMDVGVSLPRTPPITVSPSSVSSTASNRSGISPDLTYQDSLSPQPFMPARSPVQLLSKHHYSSPLPPHYFIGNPPKSEDKSKLQPDFLENAAAAVAIATAAEKRKHGSAASNKPPQNFSYHADNLSTYAGFPMGAFPFSPAATSSVPIFPTASLTAAALLPSSLAAFTLPAQNVCAKCNMHFRMTSDLVYHMRSHHKNENSVVDPYKRRRDQDKLKCPVCAESFRERHHLTRHMTAHQDKEDEDAAVATSSKEFFDVAPHRPITGSAK